MDKCREMADVEQWIKSISRSLNGKETVVHNNINQVRGIRQRLFNYELFCSRCPYGLLRPSSLQYLADDESYEKCLA